MLKIIKQHDNIIKCWKKGGHSSETFLNVVENSCNPGFVILGQRLGTETLYSYLEKFVFGKERPSLT